MNDNLSEAYLQLSRTSMMELFGENSWRLESEGGSCILLYFN